MSKILVRKLDTSNNTYKSIDFNDRVKSLDEVSKNLPQGAYTTFRTFNHNQVIHLQSHFLRLEETARLANSNIIIDPLLIRKLLRGAIEESGEGDLRVRITLDLELKPGDIYFSIENLNIPPKNAYINGVSVITVSMKRDNPKAKLTNFLKKSEAIRARQPNGVNEVLMIDDRRIILEGLSSNFFAVYKNQVWTEEENVLSGLTRKIVLEEAGKQGLNITLRGISLDQISQFDEAFLTSTSRSVLPIHEIDHILIKNGKPGPITRALIEKYQAHINAEVESI